MAEAILTFRRHRSDILPPELFSEPAWDLMLALFIADADGVRLTGREVARRSGVAGSVMARWLMHLTQAGLMVGDGDGNLDDPLTLSGQGMDRMEQLLGHANLAKDTLAVAWRAGDGRR